jgi:hypothetical protein
MTDRPQDDISQQNRRALSVRQRPFLLLAVLLAVPVLMAAAPGSPHGTFPLEGTAYGRFMVVCSPGLEGAGPTVARQMEYIMADLERFFGAPMTQPLLIAILAVEDFAKIADPKKAMAFYSTRGLLALNYGTTAVPSSADIINESTLLHEAVHAYEHLRSPGTWEKKPLWFREGLAMYLQTRLLRNTPSMQTSKVRVFTPLEAYPHENGLQAVRYLVERRGDQSLGNVLELVEQGESFEGALRLVYGLTSIVELQEELRRW